MLVEENQIPIVPAGIRHRLIGVIKRGRRKRYVVPFDAGHFASLAAYAGGGVDELANGFRALGVFSGHTSGVTTYFLNA
jgi:hypothetical protein